jgi:type IV pilus assembly protein PilY1
MEITYCALRSACHIYEVFIMKQFSIKLQAAIVGILYGAMCGSPAFAEDIEIYTGSTGASTAATANILFVLDTSGSMNGTVVGVPADYDASTTYTGCFDKDRVYVEDNLLVNAERYCTDGRYDVTTIDQFNLSAFKCEEAAGALATSGLYIDRIAQLRTSTSRGGGRGRRGGGGGVTTTSWRSVSGINDNYLSDPVECQADEGVHGKAAGDGKPYATDTTGAGGWQSGSSGAVRWSRTGSSETAYTGNYLNQIVEGGGVTTSTRLRVMQDALTDVINASSGVNIGLMRFSSDANGGLVVTPMGDIADDTHKADFLLELEKMYHSGSTPLAESYYEAVAYMQGKAVDYGDGSEVWQYVSPGTSTTLEHVDRLSHTDSRKISDTGRYLSPISDTCQKNYIVLLTDGEPTSDDPSGKLGTIGVSGGCSAIGTSSCLEEIADSIASNDQSSEDGNQYISTFTIGLDIASAAALLQGTADASKAETGVGEYYPAEDAASLTTAFANIVTQVLDVDTTFSSPAVSVNAFNRSTHLDDLYFTLFKPGDNQHWDGNLKKYKLRFFTDTTDVDGDGDKTERLPYIADANSDSHAIDPSTGFFKDSAVSYWTDATEIGPGGVAVGPDGKSVEAGGARSKMTNVRNVYTITGSYAETDGVFVPAVPALTATANALDKANADVTEAMLEVTGIPEAVPGIDYRDTVLDWAAGLDVFDKDTDGDTTDAYRHMGDPLHAEPALVQYGEVSGVADMIAYVATNDGYLHAFDVDDGSELFSFVPQELLGSLSIAMDNTGGEKLYGLDGSVVAWIKDVNKDGTVNPGEGDHVYLYVSMRRGGSNIYALDVTYRNAPRLLWMIKGGVGDYDELGDTWSTINVEKVKDGTAEKTVLVFGGGYDSAQDTATVRTADAFGRAVFIADATSGERLWMGSAGGDTDISEMIYSIPARVKPLDISGDGYMDRMYAVDMGGQIFRFDINNANGASLASSITGGRIADLAGAAAADARRFYYPPDVALVDGPSGKYHGIVIASGFRANPLNKTIHDRIYMLKDRNTGLMSTGYTTLTEADLHDATDNLAGGDGADDTAREAELAKFVAKEGWYIDLDDETSGSWEGEKGLAEPLIIEGNAIVTTYVPDFTTSTDSCAPAAGNGKVFYLDILDATPSYPQNIDKRPQRHIKLVRGGIPPTPTPTIPKDGEPTICIGTECSQADFGLGIRKTYWYEVEQ